jgi:hypothetical protein
MPLEDFLAELGTPGRGEAARPADRNVKEFSENTINSI